MTIRVAHADMLEAIPRLVAEGVVCDAVVCDPPYGLEFMGAEWDKFRGSNTGIKKSGYKKLGMNGTPVFDANRRNQKCPRCGKWAYDYPERKCICGGAKAEGRRIYCSGFQEFSEEWVRAAYTILRPGAFLVAFGGTRTYHRLACAIEDGGFVIQDCIMWLFATGFPKRRDALKPAYEPIVLAYKPGGKRTMQIDECRIEGTKPLMVAIDSDLRNNPILGTRSATFSGHMSSEGRWPANIAHDGSDEVLAAFAAYGERSSSRLQTHHKCSGGSNLGTFKIRERTGGPCDWGGDTGSAARFFMSAKAGAQDRWGSRHPTVKPVELMKWLVALVTPLSVGGRPGLVLDPFAGSGTTGVAALATGRNAILIEREAAYHADILERLAHYEGSGRHSLASKGRQARPRGETPLFPEAAE